MLSVTEGQQIGADLRTFRFCCTIHDSLKQPFYIYILHLIMFELGVIVCVMLSELHLQSIVFSLVW